jgi:hypothetical protein
MRRTGVLVYLQSVSRPMAPHGGAPVLAGDYRFAPANDVSSNKRPRDDPSDRSVVRMGTSVRLARPARECQSGRALVVVGTASRAGRPPSDSRVVTMLPNGIAERLTFCVRIPGDRGGASL